MNELRDYQKKAIADTYSWLSCHSGNPCIVAPTGSGKSHIIAGLCEDIMGRWPQSRIVILSHVKELLVQDAEKLLAAWPEAPLGIYSAGLGKKDIDAITVAGIQSIWRAADKTGKTDLVIVDEAHLINLEDCGMYRTFLNGLKEINPHLRIIGLTATPYRLGQGMITEGRDRLFDGLIESISIEELVERGYLARLRSKFTDMKLDTSGVRKRGGDFVDGDLQAKIDTEDNNARIVAETLLRAEDRRAWLVFCTGVEHARHIRDELRRQGVSAETVTGDTPKDERTRILDEFKAGHIRAVTNVSVLTTGFDYPNIDLIVMARPTLSPGLYAQMAGRGMRLKTGPYQDCLVLDFAGNIARHGPVTNIQPPSAKQKEDGEAPVKECPECHEAVLLGTRVCPCCGHIFPINELEESKDFVLNETEDIMGSPVRMDIRDWKWRVVPSKKTG
ncbi:MAG: DEAD/DEAH box helicase family protein, partial [Synergistaceae bacterium]|nr:DEAD/DEAH box helicase family protein [Synergistaceae bacterium]